MSGSTSFRSSLNGAWILDKSREGWSMCNYLRLMDVDELAVQAHDKGERETDTIHTIVLERRKVKIIKRSRVNANVVVELVLGQEKIEYLPPGHRPKRTKASSDHMGHLQIDSSLETVHGSASVHDVRMLVREEVMDENNTSKSTQQQCFMKQELTITNERKGQTEHVVRYFLPYEEIMTEEIITDTSKK